MPKDKRGGRSRRSTREGERLTRDKRKLNFREYLGVLPLWKRGRRKKSGRGDEVVERAEGD